MAGNKLIVLKFYNRYLLVIMIYTICNSFKNYTLMKLFVPVFLKVDSILIQHMA